MSNHDPTRAETIAAWKEKGLDWLCNQLWNARIACKKAKSYERIVNNKMAEMQADIAVARTIKKVNSNLSKILHINGIRPTRLRLTYYCCDADDHDTCDGDCDGCRDYKKAIGVYSFYDYEISPEKYGLDYCINGITADFVGFCMTVEKVIVEDTGEILYQSTET